MRVNDYRRNYPFKIIPDSRVDDNMTGSEVASPSARFSVYLSLLQRGWTRMQSTAHWSLVGCSDFERVVTVVVLPLGCLSFRENLSRCVAHTERAGC